MPETNTCKEHLLYNENEHSVKNTDIFFDPCKYVIGPTPPTQKF